MKRFARNAAVLLVILELSGRFLMAHQHFWYADAARRGEKEPPRYIFIGSSRVAQAILPEVFSHALGAPASATLNLGRGYSTMTQHVLGLRLLAEAFPRRLSGCTIFVEAPEGLPSLSTAAGRWFMEQEPSLLNVVMRRQDLIPFWRSDGTLQEKLSLTMGELSSLAELRGSWTYYARHTWHALKKRATSAEGTEATLVDAGGVRTDPATFAEARRLAERVAQEGVRDVSLLTPRQIEASSLMSLNTFLENENAELVLYLMPLSSVQLPPYRTSAAKRNRALVAEMLRKAGIRILHPDFVATDDDFPDSWHLSATRAPAFSRAVAAAYAKAEHGAEIR